MIKIKMTTDKIEIQGHGKTEPCARVSTVFQVMLKMFSPYVSDFKILNGYSLMNYKTEKPKTFDKSLELFKSIFIELQELYPNMITFITDIENKTNEKTKDE